MMPPDFHSWKHENLVKLAEDMYFELRELRQDLKEVLKAYRQLIVEESKK